MSGGINSKAPQKVGPETKLQVKLPDSVPWGAPIVDLREGKSPYQDARIDRDGRSFHFGDMGLMLADAKRWSTGSQSISGTAANERITNVYTAIDQAMTAYLGEPRRTNWTSFGKYASQNAGQQIARLESLQRAFSVHGERSMRNLVFDFLAHPIERFKQFRAMGVDPTDAGGLFEKSRLLRDALVNGNIAIISNIAPAYDIFLRAEVNGRNGLHALRNAGFGRGDMDPQGFILNAFEKYTEARGLADRLAAFPPHIREQLRYDRISHFEANAKTAQEKEAIALSRARDQVLYEANLLLGFQEQWFSLQTEDVFDNPKVRELMGGLSREMAVTDPLGSHRLLPFGGNWADFVTRMGLKEVQPGTHLGTFRLRDKNGVERHYVTEDCKSGTIAHYMQRGTIRLDGTDLMLDRKPERPTAELNRSPFEWFKDLVTPKVGR